MKSAVINIKTDPKTKIRAKKVAEDLGFSLSTLINAYMKTLVKTREVYFNANPEEEPSEYLAAIIREAEKEKEASPVFDNSDDAITWLKDKKRRYVKL